MKNFLFFIAAALLVASCSNSTEPTPDTTTFTVPKTGSTFTFSTYETDSTNAKIPGSDKVYVDRVVASGISYAGKTGVWAIESADASDTTYVTVDANKDVLFTAGSMSDLFGAEKWVHLPVSSGTVSKDTNVSAQDFNGVPVEITTIVTMSRETTEQLTVGSESIKSVKVKMLMDLTAKAFGQTLAQISNTGYLWYAPSLGNIIRRDAAAQKVNGNYQNGTYDMLMSYTLK